MSDEEAVRTRITLREHARPGGLDPALDTPWKWKPGMPPGKYCHPGHRWHLPATDRNVWVDDDAQPKPAKQRRLHALLDRLSKSP